MAGTVQLRSVEGRGETTPFGPVQTWNEWDPLEEVVVGRIDGAAIPSHHVSFAGNLPSLAATLYRPLAGRRYPRFVREPARRELRGAA